MEWRQQVDHALSVLHTRLDSLEAPHLDPLEPPHHRHTTAQSEEGVSGGGEAESDAHTRPPTSGLPSRAGNSANRKNAKLVKEIKDEEDAFGKRVTAGAMQAGKDASAKAMLRIDALVDTVKSLTTQSDGVQSALREELAESRRKEERMLSALEESVVAQKELRADVLALQKQAKTHEKQRSDLEEALFFLQDEIARATAKPTTAPKSAAAKGKPPAPAGKAAANKSPAKGANASPVKARK
ncbi:hypothetical protein T484DRAFT_3118514 [Baffinella frigidus]|nr:hypothetical protein T484DRAFT_3118514 [Cryptophyta sp. CCMP2293]